MEGNPGDWWGRRTDKKSRAGDSRKAELRVGNN